MWKGVNLRRLTRRSALNESVGAEFEKIRLSAVSGESEKCSIYRNSTSSGTNFDGPMTSLSSWWLTKYNSYTSDSLIQNRFECYKWFWHMTHTRWLIYGWLTVDVIWCGSYFKIIRSLNWIWESVKKLRKASSVNFNRISEGRDIITFNELLRLHQSNSL